MATDNLTFSGRSTNPSGRSTNPYLVNPQRQREIDIKEKEMRSKIAIFGRGYIPSGIINELQIDQYSLNKIVPAYDAAEMAKICSELQVLQVLKGRKPVITDGCAGVGGNTLAFILSGTFGEVNAIEIDETRVEMLRHNVTSVQKHISSLTKPNVIRGNYNELYNTLRQDILFLDPPWGENNYRVLPKVQLFLGDEKEENKKHLADVIKDVFENSPTLCVVWKAPLNFDFEDMKERCDYNKDGHHYRFTHYYLCYLINPRIQIRKKNTAAPSAQAQ